MAKLLATYHRAAPQPAARSTALGFLDAIGGLGWSVLGFVGGAVFWHFIGFWSFVSEVVLAGGSAVAPGPEQAVLLPPKPAALVRLADAQPLPASCTTLTLNRLTGLTSAAICDSALEALPPDTAEGREDRLTIVSGP